MLERCGSSIDLGGIDLEGIDLEWIIASEEMAAMGSPRQVGLLRG
ncbi:MAG: hypothetical protein RLZZ314_590 [Bacteroidota bacterium]|jgi:hypothetical protein